MAKASKRRNVKDEETAPQGLEVKLECEEDVQRALFESEIQALVREASGGKYEEAAVRRVLRRMDAALHEKCELQRDEELGDPYWETLGVKGETAIEYVPPPEPLVVMSRVQLLTRLVMTPVRVKLMLPRELFGDKDYLNHIYSWKKWMYLQHVKRMLEAMPEVQKCQMGFVRGDVRSPFLQLQYRMEASHSLRLDVIAVMAEDVFPYRRFLLEQNNVRKFKASDGQLRPTPQTNMTILRDMTLMANVNFVDRFFKSMGFKQSLLESLMLIKIWLRSHRLDTMDGYNDVTWMVLFVRSLQRGQISSDGALFSIFYSFLTLLSSSKLSKLCKKSEELWDFTEVSHGLVSSDKRLKRDAFAKLEMEWVADVTGGYNLAWDVSHLWLLHMKDAAARTSAVVATGLTRGAELAREMLTMTLPFMAQFDSIIKIPMQKIKSQEAWDTSLHRRFMKELERILTEGLKDRCSILRFLSNLDVEESETDPRCPVHSVYACINFKADTAWRAVDKGPSSEDKKATKKFRSFWGTKSELKKFHDGLICEAVTWDYGPGRKHEIPDRIVEHLLKMHLGVTVQSPTLEIDTLFAVGHGSLNEQATQFHKLQLALQRLSPLLCSLEDTALSIVSVQEVDASARRTACFVATYHPYADCRHEPPREDVKRCITPVTVFVSLETSGTWPADADAFEMTKIAMYAQLSVALNKEGHYAKASRQFVDLFFQGFVFRLRFTIECESAEMDRVERERQHHSLVKKCADRYPYFPLAVKMLKRWTSVHLFDYHLHESVLELVAVYVFEKHQAHHPVNSPVCGFFRTLHLLSEFQWSVTPLIVDIDHELSENDIRAIQKWYTEQGVSKAESCSIAVCTPFDRYSLWTAMHPGKAILSRLQHSAQRRLSTFASPLCATFTNDDLSEFDVVLYLRKEALAHPERALSIKKRRAQRLSIRKDPSVDVVVSLIPSSVARKYSPGQIRSQLLVNFDPIQILWEELTSAFGHVAVLCCDQQGGNVIGVHWKPEMNKVVDDPRVTCLLYWSKAEGGFVPDKSAILSEMCEISEGIMEDMEAMS